ncbi:unnamed protein product [Protopolystoma xenopodis]|uniref:Uncharacterized protein n=1 Tax=Protopolystoma xenopodis TaxID=117903 RepID=A0A3S5B5Q2_9PLAT|nr:unnamed protein product [Protopolystoma xenopodis]
MKSSLDREPLFLLASSPDEKALVEAAAKAGIVYTGKMTQAGHLFYTVKRHKDLLSHEGEVISETDSSPDNEELSVADGKAYPQVSLVTKDICSTKRSHCETYQIDAILDFDSTRKRMTVLARHPDGACYIHSKGAETSMLLYWMNIEA